MPADGESTTGGRGLLYVCRRANIGTGEGGGERKAYREVELVVYALPGDGPGTGLMCV